MFIHTIFVLTYSIIFFYFQDLKPECLTFNKEIELVGNEGDAIIKGIFLGLHYKPFYFVSLVYCLLFMFLN